MATKIHVNTGTLRLQDAERLLEIASLDGGYKKFENALAAFDRAIADARDDIQERKARKGKVEAQMAFARQALANRDLELAKSLVEPLRGCGRETELLKRLIKDRMFSSRLSGRDMRIYYPALVTGILIVLFVVAVNFYYYMKKVREENPYLGNLVEKVDRAINASTRTSLQFEVLTTYSLFKSPTQERRLADYKNYTAFKIIIEEAASRMEAVHGGATTKRDTVHNYLVENIQGITDFRHDLASDPDNQKRRRNALMIQHLDALTQLLLGVPTDE